MNNKWKVFFPIVIVFVIVSLIIVAGHKLFDQWKVDTGVVAGTNFILFLITSLSFILAQRGLNNSNPNVFFRSIYSGILLKLFGCIIAAFIYISIYKAHLNKPALFISMGLYLVYTFVEVSVLMKLLKHRPNG
jgi:hypothetical protein